MLVANTLEKNVRFVGFGNSHHLHIFIFVSHDLRERELAYLTLKFSEVITLDYPLNLFLDLTIYPSFQAANVNESTTSLTVTGRYERIAFSLLGA